MGKKRQGDFVVLAKLCGNTFDDFIFERYEGRSLYDRDHLVHYFLLKTRDELLNPLTFSLSVQNEEHLFDMLECAYQFLQEFGVAVDRVERKDIFEFFVNKIIPEWGYEMKSGVICRVPESGFEQLITEQVPTDSIPLAEEKIAHAIELFFKRDASDEDKKSAIKALGELLEHVRDKLKGDVRLKSDERSVFDFINNYGIRHHVARQKELGEPFLSWGFYHTLNTVKTYLKLQDAKRRNVT